MKKDAASRHDRELVRSITARLSSLSANDSTQDSAPRWLVDDLRTLFRFDVGVAYRPQAGSQGLDDRVVAGDAAFVDRYDALARSYAMPFHFDPLHPEAPQRNQARLLAEVCRCSGRADSGPCAVHDLWQKVGVGTHDQLRVLVCDDAHLVAWVGGVRAEPFTTHERELLQRLTPSLQSGLVLRRRLLDHQLATSGLAAALEEIGVPAYIAREDGAVVHASTTAKALYDDGKLAPDTVKAHIAGRAIARPLRTDGGYLVLLEGDRVAVARCATLWSATEREQDVLEHLVAGESNKEIALRLRVSEVTVERHVTALLRKAGCDSRARLIATFWRLSR